MPRTRDEAAFAARQQAILDTAESLFAERGFHNTGIAALCDALGTSAGALYRYFPSKAHIVQGLVRREADRTVARVAELQQNVHDRDSLIDVIVTDLVESLAVSQTSGAQAMTLEVWAEGARDPASAQVLLEAEQASVQALSGALAHGVDAGWIAAVDVAATARWLLSLTDGAALWWTDQESIPTTGLRRMLEALLPPP